MPQEHHSTQGKQNKSSKTPIGVCMYHKRVPNIRKTKQNPARLSVYHTRVAAQRENTARSRQRMSVPQRVTAQEKKEEKRARHAYIRDDDVLTVAYIPEIQAVATKKQVTKRSDGIQTNIH